MTVLDKAPTRTLYLRGVHAARTTAAPDWKAQAIASYDARNESAHLITELVRRIETLIGAHVHIQRPWADAAERQAGALVDGVRFRLRNGQLSIVRTCAECGSGEFLSPALRTRSDVGYALSAWNPCHRQCGNDETADLS